MTFLKLIRKLKVEGSQLKIVCVGLDNAGKTTILKNIFNLDISSISPTFGYSLYNCNYNDTPLLIYDIGGQSIFRDFWDNYFEKCDGLIFVYDLTSEGGSHLSDVIKSVPDVPVLILGNKTDLCRNNQDMVVYKNNMRLYYVSGLDCKTLKEPFNWFILKCKNLN